jgi:hypothetical protein
LHRFMRRPPIRIMNRLSVPEQSPEDIPGA